MLKVVNVDKSQPRQRVVTLESDSYETLNSADAKTQAIAAAELYNGGLDLAAPPPYGVDPEGKEIEDPFAPNSKITCWRKDYRILQGL